MARIINTEQIHESIVIGKTISHYKILEKLGEGGMGVVYKAEDTKLKRIVALKFLPLHTLASAEEKSRFVHEAQAAAALNHANICTVYEIDESEGQTFIAMEYIEGQNLKQKVGSSPLKLEETLDIAMQVAQGLHEAHEKEIVHRDIKTANVMTTSKGQVKIMDFGLAKLREQTKLTKTGTTMGTAAYMSPEQTQGEEVDQRTDIWSLGVLLYEMLTGKLPFAGDYEQAVTYSILHEEPEPITGLRTGVPMELERIVFKVLEKNPEERYQHADELLTDLQRVQKSLETKSHRFVPSEVKSRGRRWSTSPVLWTTIIVLFGLAGGVLLFYPSETIPFSERDWILITDFENLTGDGVFDKSLNIALTVSVQQSKYVNVFPRTRMQETLKRMQIEKADTLDQELGSEIAMREEIPVLVVPTISLIGGIYALSARIVDPNTQLDLGTVASQAKGKNKILEALDNLAEQIRGDLGESLASISEQAIPLPKVTTSSLEALKSFAEGRRLSRTDGESALNLIAEAVKLDSNFALAHAYLGVHYYIVNNRPKGEEHFKKALSHTERLTLRERLWVQAVSEDWRGDRERAIQSYKTFLAQYPDDSSGWFRLGYTCMITDHLEQAIDAFSRMLEIEPSNAAAQVNLATCYKMEMGKEEEAAANYLKAFEMKPEMITEIFVNHEYGFLRVRMGDIEKAKETFEKMLSEKQNWRKAKGRRSLALLNMFLGKHAVAIHHLKEAILLNKTIGEKLSEMRDHLYFATALKAKGRTEEFEQEMNAVKRLQTELNLAPFWLELIGKVYARIGRIEEARQLLDDMPARIHDLVASSGVARSNRGDQAAYKLLSGEVQLGRKNYDEAIELFEISYKLLEGNDALESLAYGYLVSGNVDAAISKYQELIARKHLGHEAQEYWILAHYQLGKIYEAKGEVEKAIEYYQQFVDIWKEGDEDLVDLINVKTRLAELQGRSKK